MPKVKSELNEINDLNVNFPASDKYRKIRDLVSIFGIFYFKFRNQLR